MLNIIDNIEVLYHSELDQTTIVDSSLLAGKDEVLSLTMRSGSRAQTTKIVKSRENEYNGNCSLRTHDHTSYLFHLGHYLVLHSQR